MLDRLLLALSAHRWNWIIVSRALRGRVFLFRDAPAHVVLRWATTDPARWNGWPELQDACGYAQAELALREREKARRTENVWRAIDEALVPPEEN